MPSAHKWQPITDLSDPQALTDGELESLYKVWEKQEEDLREKGILGEFNEKLRREWSIETGLIERVYTWDRGVTRTLIEQGIDASYIPHDASELGPEKVANIVNTHGDVLETLFDFVGGQRELSTGYINELHAALLRDVDTYLGVDPLGVESPRKLEKGKYKTLPNSPTKTDGTIHEYCPPAQVGPEMERLVGLFHEHRGKGIPPEIDAAWLHHRFTQIHPYQDGNGRVARALASLVFIRAGWFPLLVRNTDKNRYFDCLEAADRGDLLPLVRFFAEAQRSVLLMAVDAASDARHTDTLDEAISALRDKLLLQGKISSKEWVIARDRARSLSQFAGVRLEQVAARLHDELASSAPNFRFHTGTSEVSAREDYRVGLVESVGLVADLQFNRVVTLNLEAGRKDSFEIMFCSTQPRNPGLILAIAYLSIYKEKTQILEDGVFQINGIEETEHVTARFAAWLERMTVAAFNQWRKTL